MDKFLSGLKIEHWYHVFIIFGVFGAITALTFEFKGITNTDAFLLFFGIFFIGIGEWINHPLKTGIIPPNIYTAGGGIIKWHPRKNKLLGMFFDILGIILISIAIYKIIHT